MSEILGIFGVVILFVTFGLLHRNGRPNVGCSSCERETGPDCSCDLVHDTSESSHVRP